VTLDPAIAALIVACAALLFASAALHKLRDLRRFDEIFTAYGLIPLRARLPRVAPQALLGIPSAALRLRLSYAVPLLESLVAVGLLFDASRPPAVAAGMVALLAYATAIAVNLSRGRRDLACGCGGPDDRRPIAPWMIWRNVLLTLLLAALLLPWSPRSLVLTDLLTIGFGTATCALVYLCLDRLLDQAARLAARARVSS
jgi:hypothetical protein